VGRRNTQWQGSIRKRTAKKKQLLYRRATIPKSHYNHMVWELSLLHRTQFALDYVEEFPAFGGKPSACAKNIRVMKELGKKPRRKRK
jgi:hypothetical protein